MSEQLTYAEIKRRLKNPISKKLLSHKKQGGADIVFLNITNLKDCLDERIAPNHWECLIKQTMVCGENLIIIASLLIHASDGVYCQDGTGIESINLKGYGDVASNAYSQAVRRAAESHGFCRELWRMELSDEQKEIQKESEKPPLQTRIANVSKAITDLGGKVGAREISVSEQAYFESLVEQWNQLKGK